LSCSCLRCLKGRFTLPAMKGSVSDPLMWRRGPSGEREEIKQGDGGLDKPLLRRTSSVPHEPRRPFNKFILSMLSSRRFPSGVVVGLAMVLLYWATPKTFHRYGRFGVDQDMTTGVTLRELRLEVHPGRPQMVISGFLSMQRSANVHNLLLGVYSATGSPVTLTAVIYDHEGYFLRSGTPQVLTLPKESAKHPPPVGPVLPGGLHWVRLPLKEKMWTAPGILGKGQTFFLGAIIGCGAEGGNKSAFVSLALGASERYSYSYVAPRIPAHFVENAPGIEVASPKLNYSAWLDAKRAIKLSKDHHSEEPPTAGYLGIVAEWHIQRPTWQVCVVLGFTVYAVILMTDGVPAFGAFSGILVVFMLTGILTVKEATTGFAQEGILTVAVFLVVARALDDISYVEETIVWLMGKPSSLAQAHIQMMVPVAIMSAVVPNTAIISMMIPILHRWAMRLGLSPAQLMMPCSFASLLGSNLTLIGSAANLIAASVFNTIEIGMFDLMPRGILIVIVGIAYMIVASPLLLKNDAAAVSETPSPHDSPDSVGSGPSSLGRGDIIAAKEQAVQASEVGKLQAWEMPVAYKMAFGPSTGCSPFGNANIEVIGRSSMAQPLARAGNWSSAGSLANLAALGLIQEGEEYLSLPSVASSNPAGQPSPWPSPAQGRARFASNADAVELAKARLYAVQFYVDPAGPLRGSDLCSTGIQRVEGVNLFEVLATDGTQLFHKDRVCEGHILLKGGELLRARVTPAGYHHLRAMRGLHAPPGTSDWLERLGQGRRKRALVEAVVQDNTSSLFGGDGHLDMDAILEQLSAVVVGVRRGGNSVRFTANRDPALRGADNWDGVTMSSGDVLLLDARDMGLCIEGRDEFMLVRVVPETNPPRAGGFGDPARAFLGISLLCGLLVVTSLSVLHVSTLSAAWAVAALYICFDLLSFEQVMQTLNSRLPALLTLMTAIGVGKAFQESGIVDLLSSGLLSAAEGIGSLIGSPAYGLTIAIFIIVCNFAAFVNMGSAVAIMAPVVEQLVVDMPGVPLKSCALILMYAANSPFATPFGASANLMVVSSGGYTFMDFLGFGAPLQVVVMCVAVLTS